MEEEFGIAGLFKTSENSGTVEADECAFAVRVQKQMIMVEMVAATVVKKSEGGERNQIKRE
ncbi:hypothetical protein COLO4_22705 [Corchorus olitorius]|uniref:Uncharacterized protein n=1 Tax=Corchorus olitorius TaxID=93759 RepID=A0A1R3IKI4_9ROSI|nr:hypothetical protein COLO4_22705 [Corchorus olitorius]